VDNHEALDFSQEQTTWHHVTQMKNWLAWVNVAITWTYFVFFSVQDEFRDLVVECLQGLSAPGASEHTKQVQAINLHTQTKQWAQFVDWHHTLTTYISLLLMLRVFLALEAQPQLAVVLRTLRATSEDLGHFLIIIVPTFIAYAISGWCLFGRRVPEFSSILRAIGTCFKIAIESEYQWVELSAEDFLTSAIWIWSFILLIVLVMLNMVLAIIMDVYTEVRKSAGDHETVRESSSYVGHKLLYRKEWIKHEDALERIKDLPSVLTTEEFERAFVDMPKYQTTRLLNKARVKAASIMNAQKDEISRLHMLAAIKVSLDEALGTLKTLEEEEQVRVKALQVPDRPDEVCREDIAQSVAVQNHWMTVVQTQLEQLRSMALGRYPENASSAVTAEATVDRQSSMESLTTKESSFVANCSAQALTTTSRKKTKQSRI